VSVVNAVAGDPSGVAAAVGRDVGRDVGRPHIAGAIGPGLCVLVAATHGDDAAGARRLADKLWNLRILDDDDGVMNLSVADIAHTAGAAGDPGGSDGSDGLRRPPGILIVSQFTLYADTSRGRRPSWIAAARPEQAEPLIDAVVQRIAELAAGTDVEVATGRFRAQMVVEIINDGPVTVIVET